MLLKDQFESNGNWLFRWRSYLPLAIFAIVLIAMKNFTYIGGSTYWDGFWEIVCFAISFAGLGIRILAIAHTSKRTSGRNTKRQVADVLNTTGLYSIVRNPLYLGNFFMGLGVVFFEHRWWLILIYALAFWLYYERIIFAEEMYLKKKFGQAYLEWANQTPAFIPKFRIYRKAALPFSCRRVLRQEYNGFFAVIATLFLLEIIGNFSYLGKFEVSATWLYILFVGFFIWAILRNLNKHTSILDARTE